LIPPTGIAVTVADISLIEPSAGTVQFTAKPVAVLAQPITVTVPFVSTVEEPGMKRPVPGSTTPQVELPTPLSERVTIAWTR
jgi:hypothetical protein